MGEVSDEVLGCEILLNVLTMVGQDVNEGKSVLQNSKYLTSTIRAKLILPVIHEYIHEYIPVTNKLN